MQSFRRVSLLNRDSAVLKYTDYEKRLAIKGVMTAGHYASLKIEIQDCNLADFNLLLSKLEKLYKIQEELLPKLQDFITDMFH